MIYERPLIQMETLEHFFDRRLARFLNVPTDIDWRAKKIKEFIDNHPDKVDWDLDAVCKELSLPLLGRQARRVFRRAIGIGFKEYLKKSRLAFAAEQLKATMTVPIKAIAADAGYQRTAEFGRSFKRLFLLSPTEFRTVWRKSKLVA